MKRIDLTGKRFGRLIVAAYSGTCAAGAAWCVVCDCGARTIVYGGHLRSGHTVSCGCAKGHKPTHGMSRTRTYRSWKEMWRRCTNPRNDNYKWYGGRGITVASEWEAFEIFYSHMGERPAGTSLDRKDSDGPYCRANCKWSTPKEQALTNRGLFRERNRLSVGSLYLVIGSHGTKPEHPKH